MTKAKQLQLRFKFGNCILTFIYYLLKENEGTKKWLMIVFFQMKHTLKLAVGLLCACVRLRYINFFLHDLLEYEWLSYVVTWSFFFNGFTAILA